LIYVALHLCFSTYRAPEYVSYSGSIKSDVYSFGAITLEIITGEKHFKVGQSDNGIAFTPKQVSQKNGKYIHF
jgi:serine/threonine protein kinase